jgi:RNase P/RNase MRP subunit POP5
MKPLIPSHKENKRYLKVRGNNLKKNIEIAILEFVGTLGLSKVGLSFIKSGNDWMIICINREAINEVRGAFAIYSEKIITEKVSGTLKALGK